MSVITTRSSHVAFNANTPPPSSSSEPCSSPLRAKSSGAPRSVDRPILVPLAPTKLLPPSSARRAVIFSPRNDTKYFRSSDAIVPTPQSLPPPSIRSYHFQSSDDAAPSSSPAELACSSRTLTPTRGEGSSTPHALVRSILKSRAAEAIRLASTVEEGTLHNKEPARLLVSGRRPKLVARDSFQLAILRGAAAKEGAMQRVPGRAGVGGGGDDEVPASDDTMGSDDAPEGVEEMEEDESEEEEEVELEGALGTSSLVNIIRDGAEDLLTLEEAYVELTHRLREKMKPAMALIDSAAGAEETARIAVLPIRDAAPAMVRALLRDLGRLMGKVPNTENGGAACSSPFRGLQPLRDASASTSISSGRRLTPSPTPPLISPDKRQGYTEAEVRYRREASGVGVAALRFLAFAFSQQRVYSCFSDADLSSLLDQIMVIPRTPKLPTPNPKRSYCFSIAALSHMQIPLAAVAPCHDKVARAIEAAMADLVGGKGGGTAPGADMSQIKKEGFLAAANMLNTYPTLFVQHFAELLPMPLKGMANPLVAYRNRSSTICAAFAAAKVHVLSASLDAVLADPTKAKRDEWTRAKGTVAKLEAFTISHFRTAMRNSSGGVLYNATGEKRIEANALEQRFKDTIGTPENVQWACAAWSVLVCLMGASYATSGLAGIFDHIMDRSLQPSNNTVRPLLARSAWNHAIHAYLSSGSQTAVDAEGQLVTAFKPFQASGSPDANDRLHKVQLPIDTTLKVANAPGSATKALETLEDGAKVWYWQRQEKHRKLQWMTTCGQATAAVIYAYTGIALTHADLPAKAPTAAGISSSDAAIEEVPVDVNEARLERLDETWRRVSEPILSGLLAVKGADRLKSHGWAILVALTTPKRDSVPWSLDRLLSVHYLEGQTFVGEQDLAAERLMADLERASIKPSKVPGCGQDWVVRNLSQLLGMFRAALLGVHGLSDVESVKWVNTSNGVPVLPLALAQLWINVVQAVAQSEDAEGKALRALVQEMTEVFALDVASWAPVGIFNEDETLKYDAEEIRLGLASHLLAALKDAYHGRLATSTFAPLRMSGESDASSAPQSIFGDGEISAPASVLCSLFRAKTLAGLRTASAVANTSFAALLADLLELVASSSARRLGSIVGALPALPACDEMQIVVWREVAVAWSAHAGHVEQDGETGVSTGEDALWAMLALPFRSTVDAYWHQQASVEHLEAWEGLVQLGMRERGAVGVVELLEAWAGQVEGVMVLGSKTRWVGSDRRIWGGNKLTGSSSTISLSCLCHAIKCVVDNDASTTDGFVLPRRLLGIVCTALLESYPTPESLAAVPTVELSPAVQELLEAIGGLLAHLPASSACDALEVVHPAMATWLADEHSIAPPELGHALDSLYVTCLSVISAGIASGAVNADSTTLDRFIDVFAPRLSRALSRDVPQAFQAFWTAFEEVEVQGEVEAFVRDVLAAVPGLIRVRGGHMAGVVERVDVDEEDSQRRFPHSLAVARESPRKIAQEQAEAEAETLVPGTPAGSAETSEEGQVVVTVQVEQEQGMEVDEGEAPQPEQPLGSESYDADMSHSPAAPADAVEETLAPVCNPAPAAVEAGPALETVPEVEVMAEAAAPALVAVEKPLDVFGPEVPVRRKRRAGRRALAPSQSLPEVSAKRARVDDEALVPASSSSQPHEGAGQPAASGSGPRHSVLSSAGRWLAKASSFSFFSPPQEAAVLTSDSVPHEARPASRSVSGTPSAGSMRSKRRSSGAAFVPDSIDGGARKRARKDLVAPRPATPTVHADGDGMDEDDDEDDELLLSPESARLVREEEQGALRASHESIAKRSSVSVSPNKRASAPPVAKRGRSFRKERAAAAVSIAQVVEEAERQVEVVEPEPEPTHATQATQATQGRFDDAPEDLTPKAGGRGRATHASKGKGVAGAGAEAKAEIAESPATAPRPIRPTRSSQRLAGGVAASPALTTPQPPTAKLDARTVALLETQTQTLAGQIPTASPQRTDQQRRVLAMLEEAAGARAVVENLDFDGLMRLIGHVNELRDAATANLRGRVERDRATTRGGRRRG